MAVYVNVDDAPDRAVRHLDLWCAAGNRAGVDYRGRHRHPGLRGPAPTWQSPSGRIAYTSNGAALRARTVRCDRCFQDGGPLAVGFEPAWLSSVVPGSIGVYDVYDEASRTCQIGAADRVDLRGRLEHRFRATCTSRCQHEGCMWFVYDMLLDGRIPGVRTFGPEPGETPAVAEARIREARRRDGWQVASLR